MASDLFFRCFPRGRLPLSHRRAPVSNASISRKGIPAGELAVLVILQCIHGRLLYSRCISDVAVSQRIRTPFRFSKESLNLASASETDDSQEQLFFDPRHPLSPSSLSSRNYSPYRVLHSRRVRDFATCTRAYVYRIAYARCRGSNDRASRASPTMREDNPSKIAPPWEKIMLTIAARLERCRMRSLVSDALAMAS